MNIKRALIIFILIFIPTILSSCLDDPYAIEDSGSSIYDDGDDDLAVKANDNLYEEALLKKY